MLYLMSRVADFILNPVNLLGLSIFVAFALVTKQRFRSARLLLGFASACLLVVLSAPLPEVLLFPLEQRFPRLDPLPDHVDGIVLLGGAQRPGLTIAYRQASLNGAAETLTTFVALARRYPHARLIFSGGAGSSSNPYIRAGEALTVRLFLREQGLDPGRVIYEEKSRNTYENAILSYRLAQPKESESWIVIASAATIPRAIGSFRKAGWSVIAYPCDYNSEHWRTFRPTLNLSQRLENLHLAGHEWVGLAVYYWTGKTSELFPKP